MTIAASYVMSVKYKKALAAGAATTAAPLVVLNAVPVDYSIDLWSADTAQIDITKCYLAEWNGSTVNKLLALTADEKYMTCDFIGLLASAAADTNIQAFLDNSPTTIAIVYSAGDTGEATAADRLVHVQLSKFKSV